MVREKCVVSEEARLAEWCQEEYYNDITSLPQVDIEFSLLFFMAFKLKCLCDNCQGLGWELFLSKSVQQFMCTNAATGGLQKTEK